MMISLFDFNEGEIITIGHNGAGKDHPLKDLSGLISRTSGEAEDEQQ